MVRKRKKKGNPVDRRLVIYRDLIEPSKRRDNALFDKTRKDESPTAVFFVITDSARTWFTRDCPLLDDRAIIVIW